MSRTQSDREDLLREATALVERAGLQVAGNDEPVVVGFRAGGEASVFFGADPVYHFNADGELRRAYVGGLLYKAERGRLVSLRRQRSEREVALVRHDLSDSEAADLLSGMQKRLAELAAAIAGGAFQVFGQVPADRDVLCRIRGWLATLPAPVRIAPAPNASRPGR